MLHYFGVLNPPAAKTAERQTKAFGPERDPHHDDWRLSRAEADSALFSGKDAPDLAELSADSLRFASMVLPPHF